jgi:uncharacterized protein YcaQ
MVEPLFLSAQTARRIVLHLQGLSAHSRRAPNDATLLETIRQLGFVQVDSINMLERAHHMILHTRASGYRPAQLTRLLERDRALFENWTHDASVIPSAFYPYWMRRFEANRETLRARYSRWQGPDFLRETDRVLDHIADKGPVLARDLSPDTRKGPGAWWNWHPSKTALEYLWRTGDLAVSGRDGFQKVYDLTERVIPQAHRETPAEHAELIDWSCRTALERLGFGTPGEIAGFWHHITAEEAKAWCEAELGRGAVRVHVGQTDGKVRDLYARPDIEALAAAADAPPGQLRALSPFDPVLRDRKRLQGLFGFDYRIEIFVPAPQRTYGYYVFPLLEGDRLIGRIDMKADRAAGTLRVTALWPEPGVRFGKARTARLEADLDRQRRLAGLERVTFEDGWMRAPTLA